MRGRKVVSGMSSTVSSARRTRISGAGGFAASDTVHEKGKFDPMSHRALGVVVS